MEALTNIVTPNKTIRTAEVLVVNGSQGAIFTYIRILSVILLQMILHGGPSIFCKIIQLLIKVVIK